MCLYFWGFDEAFIHMHIVPTASLVDSKRGFIYLEVAEMVTEVVVMVVVPEKTQERKSTQMHRGEKKTSFIPCTTNYRLNINSWPPWPSMIDALRNSIAGPIFLT